MRVLLGTCTCANSSRSVPNFEVDEEDTGVGEDDEVRGSRAARAKRYRVPRTRGKSKNGRGDVPQVLVGLAVTRDGFPVRHWVFPGNTVDVTTVAKVKRDLKGWRLNRCVFVGDAGMVSAHNLRTLACGGGRDIVCLPVPPGGEVDREVSRRGRYRVVAENLQVKEVVVGDGERRRRYAVCFNPARPNANAPIAPRTWRWDTSNCNGSSRRGVSSKAGCVCVRSITVRCIASMPISR